MSASPTQIRSDADIKKALEETSLRLKNVVELGKYSFDLEEKTIVYKTRAKRKN